MREMATLNPDEDWYDSTWASITAHDGSIQHLDCFDKHTKMVFRTAREIDQLWIIEHAIDRQEHIDQAQSVNVYMQPNVNVKYLNAVHFMAWKGGLKSMYYCRSQKLRKADQVGKRVERQRIEDEVKTEDIIQGTACLACE